MMMLMKMKMVLTWSRWVIYDDDDDEDDDDDDEEDDDDENSAGGTTLPRAALSLSLKTQAGNIFKIVFN